MTLLRVAARDKPRTAKWKLLTVLIVYLAVYLPLGMVTHARVSGVCPPPRTSDSLCALSHVRQSTHSSAATPFAVVLAAVALRGWAFGPCP